MCDERKILRYGLGGNQHVHAANGLALFFQFRSDFSMDKRGFGIERGYLQRQKESFQGQSIFLSGGDSAKRRRPATPSGAS
jgi:hypothetical protein